MLDDYFSLKNRHEETEEKTKYRLEKAKQYKKERRENETDSEYYRRLEVQRRNDAKDKKSYPRRLKRLQYYSIYQKSKLAKESISAKRERIENHRDYQNWKDQYKW